MSKEGIWQDSDGMKDSEIVEKWTKTITHSRIRNGTT